MTATKKSCTMMSSEEEKRSHCGSRGRRDDSQLLGRDRGRRRRRGGGGGGGGGGGRGRGRGRGKGEGEGEGRHDELRGGEKEPLRF